MMYIRGARYDYDRWQELGNEGWDFDEVLPYFKKSENQERGVSEFHGMGGFLNVADVHAPHPISLAEVAAGNEMGIALNNDANGLEQDGIGLAQLNQKGGRRVTTADAFLNPVKERPNLTIHTHAHVTRLLIEGKRVVGVAYIQNREAREARVQHEVILSGGTINSPQILMLSGIGPADHLRTHRIRVVMDLPGVGQNLQDHLRVDVFYLAEATIAVPESSNTVEVTGFVRTKAGLPAPDLQLLGFVGQRGIDVAFGIGAVIMRPASRGEITLASADPFVHPIIEPNYLGEDSDWTLLGEGFRLARKVGYAKALDPFRKMEFEPGAWAESEAAMHAYIREKAQTTYHPVGTCKMGHDPMAVVNDRLQVHGIEGLRVVDGSIMPFITSGNTNAPIIMIAEKAADLIKGKWNPYPNPPP
jgi:choline dehydrogenase